MPLIAGNGTPPRFIAHGAVRPLTSSAMSTKPGTITARWAEVKRHRVGNQTGAWRLKWRKPLVSSAKPSSVTSEEQESAVRSAQFDQVTSEDSNQIQPAQLIWRDTQSQVQTSVQIEPPDPFDDPFGDEPRAAIDDAAPAPPPRHLTKAPPAQLDDNESCRQVYNDRNCCEEGQNCIHARERVRRNSIRDISLNITPQLTIAQLDIGDEEVDYATELQKELARVPARDWRNRAGQEVATGRLIDFRNGRVIVKDADGNTVKLPFAELSDDDMCFVVSWWSIPAECSLGDEEYATRVWTGSTLAWKASAICHKPLYFEEVQLERYGHSAGPIIQPALSGAHFFLNIAALPYKMGINPPNECRYPLGYYRPGNCAPWLIPPIPLSVRSALKTAAFYTGGVYIVP